MLNTELLLASEVNNIYTDIFIFPESLGDFESTGDISHDRFTSTLDGDPVVLTFDNFTVNSGHTVTTTQRCKGLYLYIRGNLTVNGTLTMSARGANAEGKYVGIDYTLPLGKKCVVFSDSEEMINRYEPKQLIYPRGGLGTTSSSGVGVNGACGAGGYNVYSTKSRRGGHGTSFSGGPGAGGAGVDMYNNIYYDNYGTANGNDNGGIGGGAGYATGHGASGGSGAGNPAGKANHSDRIGTDGTGGLLILIVDGDIIINGSITSRGSKGGSGRKYYHPSTGAATGDNSSGSGSGGGAIHIFCHGSIYNANKINVAGGTAGTGDSVAGKAGAKGTINVNCDVRNAILTPSGRKIYRHESDMGSVLCFTENDTYKEVLVLDAKYRASVPFGMYNIETPDITTYPNKFTKVSGNTEAITASTWTFTDDQIDLIWSGDLDTNTSKENTDLWLNYKDVIDTTTEANGGPITGVPAIEHCRSIEVPGLGYCDMPNFNILMRILVESLYIDYFDKTLSEYNKYNLTSFPIQTENGNGGRIWSSTKISNQLIKGIGFNRNITGYGNLTTGYYPYGNAGALPIIELSSTPIINNDSIGKEISELTPKESVSISIPAYGSWFEWTAPNTGYISCQIASSSSTANNYIAVRELCTVNNEDIIVPILHLTNRCSTGKCTAHERILVMKDHTYQIWCSNSSYCSLTFCSF